MKFILKLLLAPLMLVLWIVEWALTLALKASAVVCVIASALFLLSGFFYFVDGNVQNGCICLGIAFLLSPYGLHYLAVKLTARFIGMRMLLRERIYGYMPVHHEAIVSREQYNAVKAEMARRSALRSPSKTALTGRSCYTSKYALSDRLVCGECGTLYRRCTWTSLGRKYPVWRCTSRLNYGTKYCHESPTIKEEPLQNAILSAINAAMSDKPVLLDRIKNAVSLELLPVQGQTMSFADIERRLAQLDEQFQQLLTEAIDAEDKEACNAQFAEILAEQTALKKQKEAILRSSTDTNCVCTRMKQAEQAIENAASTITEWNENAVRQTVERVTVLSADEILVQIKGGAEIKQTINR